ncbi:MAG: DMT family transporter [Patescibacteria group bacterium]
MFFLPAWLIFSLLTGILSNTFNFMSRFILRKGDDSTVFSWYFECFRFIIFASLAFFDWRLVITPQSLLLLLLLGMSQFLSSYYYMKMHANTHLSISAILSRARMIWVPILAFIFINERLFLLDYLGILIVFLGISITTAPKKLVFDKGARYANLFAIFTAANVIFIKLLLPIASDFVIIAAMSLPGTFLYPFLMRNAKQRIFTSFRTKFPLKVLAIAISIVAMFFLTTALRLGDASKVNAIYQGMMILSVLAGIIFLHERKDIARKLIGTTITVIGVVLISFS